MDSLCGYTGKILRVDLSQNRIWVETLDEKTLRKWVGGVGLGAKYLYEEVPPGVQWSDPENRLIWTTGPLAGSGVMGAATFNVTSKGPMTNLGSGSQANGRLSTIMAAGAWWGSSAASSRNATICQPRATSPPITAYG